jgi:hypothetical protein
MTTLKLFDSLGGELAETSWAIYRECFERLNADAAQRHLMYRPEFDEVMADERVLKLMPLDDAGVPVGLATFSNRLDAFPLIAPEFYAKHWPGPYAEHRIFYCGFVGVIDRARMTSAFKDIFAKFYEITEPVQGLVALDICTRNEDVLKLPHMIGRALHRMSDRRSTYERVDAQSFWLYDVTGALGRLVSA